MYIYLGTYFHTHHKGTISVIDENGQYVTLEKKIGKTINLDQRETALNRTKSPIGYTFLKAWQTGDDTDRVELAIHDILANSRTEGEWFADDDDTLTERVTGFMSRMGFSEVNLGNDTEELVTKISKSVTVSADKIEAHKELKDKYPELFNVAKNDSVINNVGPYNVTLASKKSGYNVAVVSPDYTKYSVLENPEFRANFTNEIAEFGLVPSFNALAGYIPRITTEDQAIAVFTKLLNAVNAGTLTLNRT
jgi:hypothetical protein